jgi:hypothetical protein
MRKKPVRNWMVMTLMAAAPYFANGQASQPSSEPTTIPATLPTSEPTTLPTSEPATNPTSEPTTEATTEPTTNPTTEPTTGPTTHPTTGPTTGPTTSPTATTQPAPVIPPLTGVTEGSFFPEREGRLQRSKDGREIQFVFEQDGKQVEVTILQNLELMRLENAVEDAGWGQRFRASGWVTEYQGKNYILLDHAGRADEKGGADERP